MGVIANSKGKMVSVSKENMTRIYGDEGYRTMKVLEKLHSTYDKDQVARGRLRQFFRLRA